MREEQAKANAQKFQSFRQSGRAVWAIGQKRQRTGAVQDLAERLDVEASEQSGSPQPFHELTPDRVFERAWASSLLEQALKRLEDECLAAGKQTLFRELAPLFFGHGAESYATIAGRLAMSENHVKVSVHRLRQRCRQLLREEVARAAATPEEVNQEMADLVAALR